MKQGSKENRLMILLSKVAIGIDGAKQMISNAKKKGKDCHDIWC